MNKEEFFALNNQIIGYQITQAICAAVKLGIPDLLNNQAAMSVENISSKLGVDRSLLHRLLKALASSGIFREIKQGYFENSIRSEYLVSTARHNLAFRAIRAGEENYSAWSSLTDGIKTGVCPFDIAHDQPFFQYLENHPQSSDMFNKSMQALTNHIVPAIIAAYDFSLCGVIVDVGGGYGQLLHGILASYAGVRGVVFDSPSVIQEARSSVGPSDVTARCQWIGGDFFREIKACGDLYILRNILHDWCDADALTILKSCAAALTADSRLLVIEDIMTDQTNGSAMNLWKDLEMFVYLNGKERTQQEFEGLFSMAGMRLNRLISTSSFPFIMELQLA